MGSNHLWSVTHSNKPIGFHLREFPCSGDFPKYGFICGQNMHDMCKHMRSIFRGKFRFCSVATEGPSAADCAEPTVDSVCTCLTRSHAAGTEVRPLHTSSTWEGVFLLAVLMFVRMRGLKKRKVSDRCCSQSGRLCRRDMSLPPSRPVYKQVTSTCIFLSVKREFFYFCSFFCCTYPEVSERSAFLKYLHVGIFAALIPGSMQLWHFRKFEFSSGNSCLRFV